MQRKENLNHKDLCYKVVFQKLLLFYKVSLHFALCAAVFFVAFARQMPQGFVQGVQGPKVDH